MILARIHIVVATSPDVFVVVSTTFGVIVLSLIALLVVLIKMVAQIPAELSLALVDVNRLEQVIQNLLHNAVRHMAPGGIVAITVTLEPEAVALQVKDTGEGIAAEDLPHIWERFYRGRMPTCKCLG